MTCSFVMNRYCRHQKICYGGKNEYNFVTWSIPEISLINNLNVKTTDFLILNNYIYHASLSGSEDKMSFRIVSNSKKLKCSVSMIIGSKTLLLSNSLRSFTSTDKIYHYYDLVKLSSEDECFKKLKQNPSKTLTFICKIVYGGVSAVSVQPLGNTSTDSLYNLKSLADVLRNSPESSLKEQVLLRVGEETETVSKAVLCARSPVFAKMFENDMREVKDNSVTVADIKMTVLKELVSFLYSGKLTSTGFEMLCDLYYVSDKYDISDLRQTCVDLLIPKISMQNIYQVMKLAFTHNDELLKSTVLAMIATNIDTWFSTNDWKNLINDEPKIAAEVLSFFDI